jgi:hypothetical protein
LKTLLFILVSIIGITATSSGLMMVSDPGGQALNLPISLLDNSPFNNFFIPGILLTIIGAINLFAVFYNMQRNPNRYNWTMAGGILISGWIIVQVILIQNFYWLHFAFLVSGILIMLISLQLKGKALF